ncbi:MAG TPA: GyrI-like domain-containing protein [Roseiflexaceae bacterium]|nr:GyrI-like domain-containing protein [Roseiflexaceae bacterium]
MISQPQLKERAEQPYVGIRTQIPMSQLPQIIPQFLDELFAWLGQRGIAPACAPFQRLHVINMEGQMDVELGIPVAQAVPGDGRVSAGVIPAGRYATLVYRGLDGIPGNRALIEWAAQQGLQWDRWDDPQGDAFRSRIESFLTDPDEEPDPNNWETEVAIKLAER